MATTDDNDPSNCCACPVETHQQHILSRIQISESGCWEWTGAIGSHGYARTYHRDRNYRAHRFSYMAFVGPIPEGLVLDHLCRVRHCVNPQHLEPVTTQENIRRGLLGGTPDHGTTSRYTNQRCRCEPCVAAHAVYMKAAKANRAPLPPGDRRHGSANGYGNWRCRCDLCRGAWRKSKSGRRA